MKVFETLYNSILLSGMYDDKASRVECLSSYLMNRIQQTRVNDVVSDQSNVKYAIPERSVLSGFNS